MDSFDYASTSETTNVSRIIRALFGPCTDQLRDVMRHRVPLSSFKRTIRRCKTLPLLTVDQKDLILPRKGDYNGDYSDMDISFLYVLLRNVSNLRPHSEGWGNIPDVNDSSPSANIERIHLIRNKVLHSSDIKVTDAEFESIWSDMTEAVKSMDLYLNNRGKYEDDLDFLLKETMDPEQENHYRRELDRMAEKDKQIREMLAKHQASSDGAIHELNEKLAKAQEKQVVLEDHFHDQRNEKVLMESQMNHLSGQIEQIKEAKTKTKNDQYAESSTTEDEKHTILIKDVGISLHSSPRNHTKESPERNNRIDNLRSPLLSTYLNMFSVESPNGKNDYSGSYSSYVNERSMESSRAKDNYTFCQSQRMPMSESCGGSGKESSLSENKTSCRFRLVSSTTNNKWFYINTRKPRRMKWEMKELSSTKESVTNGQYNFKTSTWIKNEGINHKQFSKDKTGAYRESPPGQKEQDVEYSQSDDKNDISSVSSTNADIIRTTGEPSKAKDITLSISTPSKDKCERSRELTSTMTNKKFYRRTRRTRNTKSCFVHKLPNKDKTGRSGESSTTENAMLLTKEPPTLRDEKENFTEWTSCEKEQSDDLWLPDTRDKLNITRESLKAKTDIAKPISCNVGPLWSKTFYNSPVTNWY